MAICLAVSSFPWLASVVIMPTSLEDTYWKLKVSLKKTLTEYVCLFSHLRLNLESWSQVRTVTLSNSFDKLFSLSSNKNKSADPTRPLGELTEMLNVMCLAHSKCLMDGVIIIPQLSLQPIPEPVSLVRWCHSLANQAWVIELHSELIAVGLDIAEGPGCEWEGRDSKPM